MKGIKDCQSRLIFPDYLIILCFVIFILFLLIGVISRKLWINSISSQIKYLKIYKFILTQFLNSILFEYFDNLIFLLNSIITIKTKFFGFYDYAIVIFRAVLLVIPLYFLRTNEELEESIKFLNEKKEKKLLLNENKIKETTVSYKHNTNEGRIKIVTTKLYLINEDQEIVALISYITRERKTTNL